MVSNRECMAGIVFLLKTGCQWKYLPARELACGSPATVWRRFDAWSKAGIHPLIPLVHDHVHGSGLGALRYVVERTLSWFKDFRRIRGCVERFGEHLQAFHDLAASLACLNRVHRSANHF